MSQTDRQTSPSGPACRTECRARRLKLADICRAAGIARTTLDRYYHDQVKSIDREVLGRLCQYLRVKPGGLLVVVEQGDLFTTPALPGEKSP
ncbi:MAG: helix-turn-helix transcriptional regulator [Candidatus Accumulibacter propinquus]